MSGNPYSPPAAEVEDIAVEVPSPERPRLVRLGVTLLWLYVAIVMAQLVVDGVDVLNDPDGEIWRDYFLGAVVTLGIAAVMALLTWYAWKGRNWARIAHLSLLMLQVLTTALAFAAMYRMLNEFRSGLPEFFDVWDALQTLLNAIGVMLLFTPGANAWYRALKKK